MPPILALIICLGFVAALLWVERKQNQQASFALWIPTLWMLICGSRPLGHWGVFDVTDTSLEAGSPVDRFVLSILILLAIMVIYKRRTDWSLILRNNFTLIILYLFLGVSILWSDHQFVSIKRWFRLIGAIPIAMVVISERSPLLALESIFRRCAYVLLPFSIILAKYFPHFGVSYGRWSGLLSWNGVTLGKNALAHLCLVTSIFIILAFLRNRRIRNVSNVIIKKLSDGSILILAVYLLFGGPGGFSATSTATFIVVLLSLVLLSRSEKSAVNVTRILVFVIILMWPLLFYSADISSSVHNIVGRGDELTFTGRYEAWQLGLKVAARNPIIGTGFGSFWGFENEITNAFPGIGQTGHNGLLDVYIELGVAGIIMLLVFLLSFYRRVIGELSHSFHWGVFGICILIISLITNFTESLFLKSSSYIWNSMIILSIVFTEKNMDKKVLPR